MVIFTCISLLIPKPVYMKFLAGYIFLFLFVPALAAQQPSSSLLWEVSGKGLQQPSYVFGSFHLLCKGDFTISETLEHKISSCKSFYGELKMDEPGLQEKMMLKLVLNGKNFQQLLGEENFNSIGPLFQSITGMPLILLNNFKPFLHLSLLAQKAIPCADQVQPETEFTKLAQKHGLEVLGLETIDDQINAIDKEPLDSQLHSLVKMVQNFDSVKQVMAKLMEVYKLRDIDSVYRFMQTAGMDEDFTTTMITRRNEKWIPLMQKAMADQPVFFAVGAGHLGGTEGVISLLRKQGYRLTPVKF